MCGLCAVKGRRHVPVTRVRQNRAPSRAVPFAVKEWASGGCDAMVVVVGGGGRWGGSSSRSRGRTGKRRRLSTRPRTEAQRRVLLDLGCGCLFDQGRRFDRPRAAPGSSSARYGRAEGEGGGRCCAAAGPGMRPGRPRHQASASGALGRAECVPPSPRPPVMRDLEQWIRGGDVYWGTGLGGARQ